jgi:hypothetical protein
LRPNFAGATIAAAVQTSAGISNHWRVAYAPAPVLYSVTADKCFSASANSDGASTLLCAPSAAPVTLTFIGDHFLQASAPAVCNGQPAVVSPTIFLCTMREAAEGTSMRASVVARGGESLAAFAIAIVGDDGTGAAFTVAGGATSSSSSTSSSGGSAATAVDPFISANAVIDAQSGGSRGGAVANNSGGDSLLIMLLVGSVLGGILIGALIALCARRLCCKRGGGKRSNKAAVDASLAAVQSTSSDLSSVSVMERHMERHDQRTDSSVSGSSGNSELFYSSSSSGDEESMPLPPPPSFPDTADATVARMTPVPPPGGAKRVFKPAHAATPLQKTSSSSSSSKDSPSSARSSDGDARDSFGSALSPILIDLGCAPKTKKVAKVSSPIKQRNNNNNKNNTNGNGNGNVNNNNNNNAADDVLARVNRKIERKLMPTTSSSSTSQAMPPPAVAPERTSRKNQKAAKQPTMSAEGANSVPQSPRNRQPAAAARPTVPSPLVSKPTQGQRRRQQEASAAAVSAAGQSLATLQGSSSSTTPARSTSSSPYSPASHLQAMIVKHFAPSLRNVEL